MNKDLTVGKADQVLWRFCLPLFGSIVFQQLYNIADSLVAGKLVGENALAAVGNSYEITLILIAFSFGCNMGCSVLVSQLFGAKRYGELKSAVSTACIFSGILCLGLMAFTIFGGEMLLHLIKTPEDIFADSTIYLDIYVYGLPFVFFYNIATGIFSGLGDSRTPFLFLAASSVSNIFMDIVFVLWFLHMGISGVAGVAWATFLCQGVSCILAMTVVFRRLSKIGNGIKAPLFDRSLLKKFLIIAVPSICQQSFISVGNIVIWNSGYCWLRGSCKAEQSGDYGVYNPGQWYFQLYGSEYGSRKVYAGKGRNAGRGKDCVDFVSSSVSSVFFCRRICNPFLYE